MVEGLDGGAAGSGFQASSRDRKSFTFSLTLKGLSTRSYSQNASVHSRGNPLYPRPGEGSLCGVGMYNWAVGSSTNNDTLLGGPGLDVVLFKGVRSD